MRETPFQLGPLTLPNRLVYAPMTTYASLPDGTLDPKEETYLAARPGWGLMMTAACFVHPSGKAFPGQWGCESDDRLPSLKRAADAIRQAGNLSCLQIHHGGRQAPSRVSGNQPWSASAIPSEREGAETPHAMTEAEIEEVIAAFAAATRRAHEAGFDSVEIHGANTYLLQQFVSPHSNRRDDRWGADRLLFSQRIVEACLAAVPGDFPIGYRFSPEELESPGIRWDDTAALIDRLCGFPLAFLHVSLGRWDQGSHHGSFEGPTLKKVAEQMAGRLPLIGVGSVQRAADVEGGLDLGADLMAVGRAAITEVRCAEKLIADEPVNLTFPAQDAEARLVLPTGLANRIRNAPGWFPMEEPDPVRG